MAIMTDTHKSNSSNFKRHKLPDNPAEYFAKMYELGAPWEIGKPQQAIVELLESGNLAGNTVLDIGCGTGDIAVLLAEHGFDVTGIDIVESALQTARAKASGKKLDIRFIQGNALDLSLDDKTFDIVIDIGMFHIFPDSSRDRYVKSVMSVMHVGSSLYILCFSDQVPEGFGPRRISMDDIYHTFNGCLAVRDIRSAVFETKLDAGVVHAWLARIERVE